jgi:hypothetical protein
MEDRIQVTENYKKKTMAQLIGSRAYSIKAQGNGKVDTCRYAAFPARFLLCREIPDADKLEGLRMVLPQ